MEFFDRYIAPELRSIRRGRRRLWSLFELLLWLWREAEPDGDGDEAIERSSSGDPASVEAREED